MFKKSRILRAVALLLVLGLTLCPLLSCADTEKTKDPTDKPVGSEIKNKRVAFTFDDGPTPTVTDKILDKLEAIGGRATFFQVGNRHDYIKDSTYQRIADLGCEVGTHTFSHPSNFASMSESATREQLTKSVAAIKGETQKSVTLFRPVGGAAKEKQLLIAAELGLHTVNWSLDTEDWREQTSNVDAAEDFIEEKVNYIVENATDGEIILMHELYLSSYEIFARAADKLTQMGFELVTVSEILELSPEDKPTAKIHRKGDPVIIPGAAG